MIDSQFTTTIDLHTESHHPSRPEIKVRNKIDSQHLTDNHDGLACRGTILPKEGSPATPPHVSSLHDVSHGSSQTKYKHRSTSTPWDILSLTSIDSRVENIPANSKMSFAQRGRAAITASENGNNFKRYGINALCPYFTFLRSLIFCF
jgi:hypothetical protein